MSFELVLTAHCFAVRDRLVIEVPAICLLLCQYDHVWNGYDWSLISFIFLSLLWYLLEEERLQDVYSPQLEVCTAPRKYSPWKVELSSYVFFAKQSSVIFFISKNLFQGLQKRLKDLPKMEALMHLPL